MGLCKCRTVTNLFCFDHRKNVCEKCIITDHPQCIVNSYLQWLQDSDFKSECGICKSSLKEGELIRLCCLDLFHLECINAKCNMLPENTPMNKYTCPTCKKAIIPSENVTSPLASIIRVKLADSKWAKPFLPKKPTTTDNSNNMPIMDVNLSNIQNASFTVNTYDNTDVLPTHGLTKPQIYGIRDGDEDKYGTKKNETNLLKEFISAINTHQRFYKKKILYGLIVFIIIFTFLSIISYLIPSNAENDFNEKMLIINFPFFFFFFYVCVK